MRTGGRAGILRRVNHELPPNLAEMINNANAAGWADTDAWDVEDDQLLAAAEPFESLTETAFSATPPARSKAIDAAENAAKENILHLRLERADHDALEALVLSTGLDRGALARLVIRAGLRVAENDPRDLLAPKPTKG